MVSTNTPKPLGYFLDGEHKRSSGGYAFAPSSTSANLWRTFWTGAMYRHVSHPGNGAVPVAEPEIWGGVGSRIELEQSLEL